MYPPPQAVTHVDGTSRLQSVREESEPLYYKLIKAFFKLTGVPMVLNTSSTPPQHLLNTSSTPPQHLLNTSSTPPQHLLNTSSTPPQHLLQHHQVRG